MPERKFIYLWDNIYWDSDDIRSVSCWAKTTYVTFYEELHNGHKRLEKQWLDADQAQKCRVQILQQLDRLS